MKRNYRIIFISTLLLALLLPMQSKSAVDESLCAPFKDAGIDQALIETMLKSAIDGDLYRIKPGSSRMGFCVESTVGLVKGDFQRFKGGMTLKGNDSQSMVTIDVASLNTNVLLIEKLLKSESFLDAEKHPKLVFASTSFEWIDETNAILKGSLSMRGVTKPVAFYVTITEESEIGSNDTILIKATTTVNRAEFGMSSLSTMVDEKVNLCMSIEAEKYRT